MKQFKAFNFSILFSFFALLIPFCTSAFPIYSKYIYKNPRGADGTISCANCHLGNISFNAALPTVVFPDKSFNLKVKVPYEPGLLQVSASGEEKVPLLVGMVVLLPEGFYLSKEGAARSQRLVDAGADPAQTIQPYSAELQNALIIGPVSNEDPYPLTGDKDVNRLDVPPFSLREFTFSVSMRNRIRLGAYSVVVGANLGRGQIYPSGVLSNVNPYCSTRTGLVRSIKVSRSGRIVISSRPPLASSDAASSFAQFEETVRLSRIDRKASEFEAYVKTYTLGSRPQTQVALPGAIIPLSMPFFVDEGYEISINPNMGGFAQRVFGIEVQNPVRCEICIFLCFYIHLVQVLFVIKKFQYLRAVLVEL